ncbi:DUF2868 domain-containing protein [Inhella gelatinilytica]|uniref:DUF2868 domain-containing protein n=1 Tax=Inhella gelatinilytica TaxID=2795030 RepID=A0A931IZM8_9BURK|nr:DUF2868 domain-containing protein [Inhella gelatinilytica]MBH9553950.1 DUF2868 domain-containing protein [Inhella gelatinilytica]
MARLSEQEALAICVVRSIEQSAQSSGLWTKTEATKATQAALDLTGARASFSEMLARRAQWAINHLAQRSPEQALRIKDPKWLGAAAWLLCAAAFLAGCATDHLASGKQVNVVEYSLVGLFLWNFFVYFFVLDGLARTLLLGAPRSPSVISESIAKLRFRSALKISGQRTRGWLLACQERWIQLSRTLSTCRTNAAFHGAAVCFALGVLAMLYWRGLPTQYQASVAGSTWLDIEVTYQVFTFIVTPGARLFGLQIPSPEDVATLHANANSLELARGLFHLHAASLAVWVLIPRTLLALISLINLWRLRRAFPLPITAAYFTALRSVWRGQKIAVAIVPFRYEMSQQARLNLQKMLERGFGLSVDISIQQPVLMGDNPADWKQSLNKQGHVAVIPVFNVAATAESNAHGVFLTRLRSAIDAETPLVPIVDTAAFTQEDPRRLPERQAQWRRILDKVHTEPLFLDLESGTEGDISTFQNRMNRDDSTRPHQPS